MGKSGKLFARTGSQERSSFYYGFESKVYYCVYHVKKCYRLLSCCLFFLALKDCS